MPRPSVARSAARLHDSQNDRAHAQARDRGIVVHDATMPRSLWGDQLNVGLQEGGVDILTAQEIKMSFFETENIYEEL